MIHINNCATFQKTNVTLNSAFFVWGALNPCLFLPGCLVCWFCSSKQFVLSPQSLQSPEVPDASSNLSLGSPDRKKKDGLFLLQNLILGELADNLCNLPCWKRFRVIEFKALFYCFNLDIYQTHSHLSYQRRRSLIIYDWNKKLCLPWGYIERLQMGKVL